jgi:hypothetical protein
VLAYCSIVESFVVKNSCPGCYISSSNTEEKFSRKGAKPKVPSKKSQRKNPESSQKFRKKILSRNLKKKKRKKSK